MKAQPYESKAPSKDTSYSEAAGAGNDNQALTSPKATVYNYGGLAAQLFRAESNEGGDERMMDDDDLRCDETIHEEGSASTQLMESSIQQP